MKKQFVILTKGNICYGSASYFARRLNEEFLKAGRDSVVVQVSTRDEAVELAEKIREKKNTAGIIDFNTDLYSYGAGSTFVFDIEDDESSTGYVPLWHVILDHPLYHNSVLKNRLHDMRVICLDDTHAALIRKYYSNIREVYVRPLPADTAERLVPYNERSIDVLFTGTYTASEDIVNLAMQSGTKHMEIFQKMADYLINNPSDTIETAFRHALHDTDENLDSDKGFMDSLELNFFADMFIRAVIREEVLMEMLRSGIDVDIFGHGWERFILKCDMVQNKEGIFGGKIKLHGETDYQNLPDIYADSKIALNVLPWFKAGQHDRISLAMCNGSVCVSDESVYLEKRFVDGEEIFMYSLEDMHEAAEIIKNLQAQPLEAAKTAAKGYACAIRKLSFKKYSEIFMISSSEERP